MSFAKEKALINLPSHWYTLFLIVVTIVTTWACVNFDNARGAGYFTVPVIALLVWSSVAEITFLKTPKIKMCVWAFCFLYWSAGNAFLMQVISVEKSDPLISSGPIYEVSAVMAKKPQN